MKSLLQRLLPRFFPALPVPAPGAPTETVPPPVSQDTQGVAAPLSKGPRRPLIASDGAIVGFEFRIHPDILERLGQRTDSRGRAGYVAAVLTSARLMAKTGRMGFARVPLDWLAHASGVEAAVGVWIGVEPAADPALDSALLPAVLQVTQQLRTAGAKVGWGPVTTWAASPDFVLLHQGTQLMAALLEQQKSWPSDLTSLPTLITDIANAEDLEMALDHGIHFACGDLAPASVAGSPRKPLPLPPEVHRVGHLLSQLSTGLETADIVSSLKSDVGLSYRLLKRINSANFAQLSAGTSVDQAVLLLGRKELYRWLSLLLVQFAGLRKVSSALQEITLWRSRLLELLALENHEEAPDQLFTLGLASMLGTILKISQDDVVATLNLPSPARQALLEQSGPWHVYLQIVWQLESHQLDDSGDLVDRFGGGPRIAALADEAWSWAWAAEHASRQDATGV